MSLYQVKAFQTLPRSSRRLTPPHGVAGTWEAGGFPCSALAMPALVRCADSWCALSRPYRGGAPPHGRCLARLESRCKANIVCALPGKAACSSAASVPGSHGDPHAAAWVRRTRPLPHARHSPLRLAPCPPGRRRTQKSNGQDERNANRKKLRWRSAIAFFCGALLSGQPLHEKTQDKRLFVQRAQKLLFGQLCFFVWGAWVPPLSAPFGGSRAPFPSGGRGAAQPPLRGRMASPRSFLGFLCRCGGTAFHGLQRAFRASAFVQGFPSSAATRSAECAHGAQCF